jgi:hypothetical protein
VLLDTPGDDITTVPPWQCALEKRSRNPDRRL